MNFTMATDLPSHIIFGRMLELEYHRLEMNIRSALDTVKIDDVTADPNYEELKSSFHLLLDDSLEAIKSGDVHFFLKHALFISAYSFMEHSLKKFCELTTIKYPQYKRRLSDFEKAHQYYSYLINDLHLNKLSFEDDWDKLTIFKDIRNSMVHYNSTIGKNISTKTYNYIKEDPGIQFEEPRSFYLKNNDLIVELIIVSKRLLGALIQEYDRVIVN